MSASLPAKALSQHVGIVGQTGSGKSYLTRAIVEQLFEERRRVCILDYTGVWWGLRSSATGKSRGYPEVIFGGDHADVPLNEQAAHVVAKFVATGDVPSIIDLDSLSVGAGCLLHWLQSTIYSSIR
jgi:DNA helicase HerA-like ATPase